MMSNKKIKMMIKASSTNNIFIEFLQFNIPSGIDKTEADYYILIISLNEYILIKTDTIKKINKR